MRKSIELFAGAGGLALGVAKAGFKHIGIYEWNAHACNSIMENIEARQAVVKSWPVVEPTDVSTLKYPKILKDNGIRKGDLDLLAGGPPCQPFSLAGKHRGHLDKRDMFPEVIRAVREIRPKAFIVENVKGLWRKSFSDYREYIELQLMYPDEVQSSGEDTEAHLARLRKIRASDSKKPVYELRVSLVNSANYGVPQTRERVIFVGFRNDLNARWEFPDRSHSLDALLVDQWITGAYWRRHKIPKSKIPEMPRKFSGRVKRLKAFSEQGRLLGPDVDRGLPWLTVRDMFQMGPVLPDPLRHPKKASKFLNHEFIEGAKAYIGHTGSAVDLPAKTLKAGDHGVPGGENMLRWPDERKNKYRYFTVREAARLQTFPDDYRISGSWSEVMRQIGNAVPVLLAEVLAISIAQSLDDADRRMLHPSSQRIEVETESPRDKLAS